jgi:hypothetical protein
VSGRVIIITLFHNISSPADLLSEQTGLSIKCLPMLFRTYQKKKGKPISKAQQQQQQQQQQQESDDNDDLEENVKEPDNQHHQQQQESDNEDPTDTDFRAKK